MANISKLATLNRVNYIFSPRLIMTNCLQIINLQAIFVCSRDKNGTGRINGVENLSHIYLYFSVISIKFAIINEANTGQYERTRTEFI